MSDFEALYIQHFTGVYRFLYKLTNETSLAEDLTQETFYRAMKGWKNYRSDCSEYSWLCQIAKNAYFSHQRKYRAETNHPNNPSHMDAPDVLSTVLVGELSDALHQNLHTLQEPYKEVFTLRIFADLPYADIARLFGKSDSWARVVFFRAKMMLINAIKEEPEDV